MLSTQGREDNQAVVCRRIHAAAARRRRQHRLVQLKHHTTTRDRRAFRFAPPHFKLGLEEVVTPSPRDPSHLPFRTSFTARIPRTPNLRSC